MFILWPFCLKGRGTESEGSLGCVPFALPAGHLLGQSTIDWGWWVSAGQHRPLSSFLRSWGRSAPSQRKEVCNLRQSL